MTTIAASEQWSFAGTSLSTLAYFVTSLTGADEMPPLRGEDVALPTLPGRRALGTLWDARRISLGIVVMPQDATGVTTGTSRANARANFDVLKQLLATRSTQALTRLMPDGTTRTGQAKCVAATPVTDRAGGEVFTILADFELADPFLYGAAVVDSSRVFSASPLSFTITHPGNVVGWKVAFDILGPATGPVRITNATTGTWVETSSTIGAAQHYLLDLAALTATIASADVTGTLAHSGAHADVPGAWLPFVPGGNSLVVTAASGLTAAGRVTTTFQPPFI